MFMLTLMQDPETYAGGTEETNEIIANLLQLIKLKSAKLYLHSQQVANYAVSVAAKMRLPREEIERIRVAALLHDLGQVTVPTAILMKLPYLSTREKSIFKNHCNAGSYMLENMASCQELIPYIRYHHERWDGTGYPKRLKGVNIPLGARIIAVVNHYDRFINPCTQNWQKTNCEAVKELLSLSGMAFDPEVVRAFIEALGAEPEDI
ncbi:HD domain-containing protein|uniref:HDIG domain-containing protein n=2 Tax=Dendrosporobacter quercicolus TaxID=146817 RepID=A0A1G9WT95_9FIRM|nr:HD domain-containing protein [Dendrosporobacter quercicolus DSM 1736]SDM87647.1 HDIG domain-containing protein [Dendrosporobacter quercicolus]